MNKKGLFITLAVAVVIAAIAYIAGSVNKDNDQVAANQTQGEVNDNVDFGYLGYVYQKDTVTSLTTDVVLPQAANYDSQFYIVFPDAGGEQQINYSASSDSSKIYSTSATIVDNMIEISQYNSEDTFANPSIAFITPENEQVDCAGTQCLWEIPDATKGEIVSPNYQYVTTVSYQEPTEQNPDVPVAPTFKSLEVSNHDDQVLYSYKAEDYSDLGGIFPIAFSPDSNNLLLQARYAQPQDIFLPQTYYLQKLGGDKTKLISFNTDAIPSDGNYTQNEVQFVGFMNSHAIYGSDIKQRNVDNVPQDRVNSLVTFDIDNSSFKDTGITYRELIDFDTDNAVAYYFDANGHYSSYNFITQEATNLTPDFTFPEYANPAVSSNYRLVKYEVNSERVTQDVRGTFNVNGAQNKEQVTDTYVYDVASQSQKKILTSAHNETGDAIGDKFYTFVGFMQRSKLF